MRRTATYIAAAAIGLAATSAQAQVIDPNLVTDAIVQPGAIGLTTIGEPSLVGGVGDLGELIPFSGEFSFQQQVELTDPPAGVSTPPGDRLFKHDYTFSIPASASNAPGGFVAVDESNMNVMFMGQPVLDIRQFTTALFSGTSPSPSTLLTPPGIAQVVNPQGQISVLFSGLEAGDYTLRVAGILSGFDVDEDWHGEYQGNIAITPLPGAAWFFVSAIGGLVWLGRRRRLAA